MNSRRIAESRQNVEECVRLACLLEATARKPGNVHPQASFDDLTYADFLSSADVIAPVLARSRELGVGRTILTAIQKTHANSSGNTNLGIVLLLAPLAAVPAERPLTDGIGDVLGGLTNDDAAYVYEAIRLANPGGMGKVHKADLSQEPTGTLLEMMQLAADRDSIAAEYANGFDLVLNTGVPLLEAAENFTHRWEEAIIHLHLKLMADVPDTLIARKCGRETAESSAAKARGVLGSGWPATDQGQREFDELDRWLRADGNRRNPGTTADLVTAVLFAALREGRVPIPEWQIPKGF